MTRSTLVKYGKQNFMNKLYIKQYKLENLNEAYLQDGIYVETMHHS